MNMSDPPVHIEEADASKITFAHVAMRVARDGPMYAMLAIVAMMVWSGKATAIESIMGAALGFLARSYPNPIDTTSTKKALVRGMGAGMLGVLFTFVLGACIDTKTPLYGAGLAACNQTAKTCEESIRCENDLRKANNRPPRDIDAGCK